MKPFLTLYDNEIIIMRQGPSLENPASSSSIVSDLHNFKKKI